MSDFLLNDQYLLVISIVIVILGAISIYTLPVEQYPKPTPPNIQVTASYQGADAMAVDEAVTTPIGEAIVELKICYICTLQVVLMVL